MLSDILFPYRSSSPRPHPHPTQHPETDPKQTRNGTQTEPNGAEMDRNQAFRGGMGGGFVGVGGVGGCKGRRNSLPKLFSRGFSAYWGEQLKCCGNIVCNPAWSNGKFHISGVAFERTKSETGRIQFRRAQFQTPSSVSFFYAHRVPGRELSEFLSAYFLCAKANSPSFFSRTHQVCPKTQWVLFRNSTLETVFRLFPKKSWTKIDNTITHKRITEPNFYFFRIIFGNSCSMITEPNGFWNYLVSVRSVSRGFPNPLPNCFGNYVR